MNQPWIYMCSPSWTPLPPPSPPHPSGSSQCTSPEYLSHASNLGWWTVLLFVCFVSLRIPNCPSTIKEDFVPSDTSEHILACTWGSASRSPFVFHCLVYLDLSFVSLFCLSIWAKAKLYLSPNHYKEYFFFFFFKIRSLNVY